MYQLKGIASRIGIDRLWYKDEAGRFGLGSFKALGGAYAVFVQLKQIIRQQTGEDTTIRDLLERRYEEAVSRVVVTCATDGNHGRSVAWGAQLFGCQSIIYIHKGVSVGRQQALESYGAKVIRIDGNYDEAVRQAACSAGEHGHILVSDTGDANNMEIPKFVTLGYTVLLREIIEQLQDEIPTHIFVQGGVGGLASAVCSYFWQYWGKSRPRLIIVEPEAANCLQQSAQKGSPSIVKGELSTLMAGLACGEVSLLAWKILSVGCDDFMTVEEGAVGPTMRLLAFGRYGDPCIEAGESAVAGLAALIGASQSGELAATLGIDRYARVLVIGTEGATDPDIYQAIIDCRD